MGYGSEGFAYVGCVCYVAVGTEENCTGAGEVRCVAESGVCGVLGTVWHLSKTSIHSSSTEETYVPSYICSIRVSSLSTIFCSSEGSLSRGNEASWRPVERCRRSEVLEDLSWDISADLCGHSIEDVYSSTHAFHRISVISPQKVRQATRLALFGICETCPTPLAPRCIPPTIPNFTVNLSTISI